MCEKEAPHRTVDRVQKDKEVNKETEADGEGEQREGETEAANPKP